jgi:hypothetical protein
MLSFGALHNLVVSSRTSSLEGIAEPPTFGGYTGSSLQQYLNNFIMLIYRGRHDWVG